jgi:hypothetical protein
MLSYQAHTPLDCTIVYSSGILTPDTIQGSVCLVT